MVSCLLLCIGNLHIWSNTHSGTATIISQPNIVSLVLLPIGPKLCVAILSFSKKEFDHLMKVLTNHKYPKWALDKVEKRPTRSSQEVNDGADSQATAGVQSVTNEVKTKGHIVIPYTQGLYKSIKKICGRYGIQIHCKGNSTIKNLLVSSKDKDPMVKKVRPCIGFSVVTLHVMMNTQGKPPGPLEKESKSI